MNNMRKTISLPLTALCAVLPVLSAPAFELDYGAAGWTEFGRIERSEVLDPTNNYNKNWMQNSGAVLNISAHFDEQWSAGFGFGVVGTHLARGDRSQVNYWYPFWVPFISETRITRNSQGFTEESKFQLTLGNFGYGYNPDTKNLGQYLMRGYVYPGAIVSGFGNIFGAVARYEVGNIRNDFILKSENEDRPIYDFSVANVFTWTPTEGVELGAGINFYRLIMGNNDFRDPGTNCPIASGNSCYILGDSTGVDSVSFPGFQIPVYDTITGDLAGTKLMFRFGVDPKPLLGLQGVFGRDFGASDLKLYGEVGVIGLKDYPEYYDDIMRRIPVMLGMNLPAMGYLDYLSVEVQYYASRNFVDTYYTGETASWLPREDGPAENADTSRDNWKWSVNAAKVLFGSMEISAQVANDHLRPGGSNHSPSGVEALTTPKDWYWTAKLAYFF